MGFCAQSRELVAVGIHHAAAGHRDAERLQHVLHADALPNSMTSRPETLFHHAPNSTNCLRRGGSDHPYTGFLRMWDSISSVAFAGI